MTDCLDLSKFALTRMSHDLAGITGAVSNSLELLDEVGGADAESLSLAMAAAQSLIARLSFFRAAFGAEGPLTGVDIAFQTAQGYLKSLENSAVHYECSFNLPSQVPMFVLRLSLLGVQICADSLIRGGKIFLAVPETGGKLEISAAGGRIAVEEGPYALLNKSDFTLNSPKQAAAAFFMKTADRNKLDVVFEQNGETMKISCFEKQ